MWSKILHDEKVLGFELNNILSSSYCGIIVIDSSKKILQISEQLPFILDVNKPLVGKNFLEDIFKDALDFSKLMNSQTEINTQIFYSNGRKFLIESHHVKASEKIEYYLLLVRNKTKIDDAISRIYQKNEIVVLLDNIIEHSYDGIYITDNKATTLLINKAYERITGLTRENMLNKNMEMLVKEGYISKSGSLTVLKTKKTVTINQSFKTGKKALITSKPVFDADGNIILIITNVRDITELYSLKKRLDEQENLTRKYYEKFVELKNQLPEMSDIIAEDKKMIDLLYSAKKVAAMDITVQLSGESGVGKEVLARFIHKNSLRKDQEFVNVNCGAIPENLIETELFGYVKGAFSGADPKGKKGLFELADKGTLFLDEIGELPLQMQVKLLKVLQEQEFTRVGDVKTRKVNVRVISATNKDLEEMISQKKFRADLFYRLNVVPLKIPALRERKQDINALIRHFLTKANERYQLKKSISRDALTAFDQYSWPGNIRELKNIVERTVVLSKGDVINCEDLPNAMYNHENQVLFNNSEKIIPLKEAVAAVESQLIKMAYDEYGNVRDAAKALGIDASTFVRKRQKYS